MYKEYPANRVCAIDYYPLFLEALKETYQLAKKFNIPFRAQGKGSADIQKFFYHYCLEKFCTGYKNCKSKYPKVITVYPLPKDIVFNDKSLNKILSILPVPWVRCSSFNSPDTEMACVRAINKSRNTGSRLNTFADKYALHRFLISQKNLKLFSGGSVDLSGLTE
jgi:hypothetical protein